MRSISTFVLSFTVSLIAVSQPALSQSVKDFADVCPLEVKYALRAERVLDRVQNRVYIGQKRLLRLSDRKQELLTLYQNRIADLNKEDDKRECTEEIFGDKVEACKARKKKYAKKISVAERKIVKVEAYYVKRTAVLTAKSDRNAVNLEKAISVSKAAYLAVEMCLEQPIDRLIIKIKREDLSHLATHVRITTTQYEISDSSLKFKPVSRTYTVYRGVENETKLEFEHKVSTAANYVTVDGCTAPGECNFPIKEFEVSF